MEVVRRIQSDGLRKEKGGNELDLRAREGVEEVRVLRDVMAEGVEAQVAGGEGEEEGCVRGEGGLPRGGGDPEAAGRRALGNDRGGRGGRHGGSPLACRRPPGGGGDEKWAWQRETEAAENKHIRISVCIVCRER